jgi:hypothetical protein
MKNGRSSMLEQFGKIGKDIICSLKTSRILRACKVSNNTITRLILLVSCPILICSCGLQIDKTGSEPILYFARHDASNTEMVAADSNTISHPVLLKIADTNSVHEVKDNLIVATHGWYEKVPWSKDLVLAIEKKVNSEKWFFGWYDWHCHTQNINPIDVAKKGRDVAGPLLAKKILEISKDWRHIHLIGHSAGSWVISEAAKIIVRETNASIHLTFLDAYIPPFWQEDKLAEFPGELNSDFWADHYFTWDSTLGFTAVQLTHAYNVDVTNVDPDISDHEFAAHWYLATVTGQYAIGRKYEGKELFSNAAGVEYGFSRSFEAGETHWSKSILFDLGNKPLKLKRPKRH